MANYAGVLAGAVLAGATLIALYRAWYYYHRIYGLWKTLARRTVISLMFFLLGAISTEIDSLLEVDLWEFMATFYTLSYATLLSTVFLALRAAHKAKKSERKEETPRPSISGGYILREDPSIGLMRALKRASNGLMVISRKPLEEWVEKYGVEPEKFLWLSRVSARGTVDPSKLHVIQGEVLQFIEGRENAVIYLEGVEYLLLYNEFPSVAKFLFSLKDSALLKGALLLLYLPEGVMDEKGEAVILREFEPITEKELLKKLSTLAPELNFDELALFGALPPTTKKQESENAGSKSTKREGGNGKKEA